MTNSHHRVRFFRGTCLAAVAVIVAACANNGTGSGSSSGGSTVLTVAYSQSYAMFTPGLATKYWTALAHAFEAAHPKVKVQLIPIPGAYNDIITKMSLLLRSSATAPDVADIPGPEIGVWQSSGYLQPLNSYLANAAWFGRFPKAIQDEGRINGQVYAVNQGENDNAIWYNMSILRKAGIRVPWAPRTWNDMLAAARAVKAKVPGVYPFFLFGSNATGAAGLLTGPLNFLIGSTTPYAQDPANGKWIVDSAGLREVFQLYHEVAVEGLNAPLSQVLSAGATGLPTVEIPKGELAIVPFGNYNGGQWNKTVALPYWPQAPGIEAVTPIPTINGQAPGFASTADGWDYAMYSHAPDKQLAWEFINMAESPEFQVLSANYGGYVPPDPTLASNPAYLSWAPPYQKSFADILPKSTITLATAPFTKWSYGFGVATALMLSNPNATVTDGVNAMRQAVEPLLGASSIESYP
jgi:multiple sugar transport system substrate-binding protein